MGKCISIMEQLEEKKEYMKLNEIQNTEPLYIIYLKPVVNDCSVLIKGNTDFTRILSSLKEEITMSANMILSDFNIDEIIDIYNGCDINLCYVQISKNSDNKANLEVIINGEFEKYLNQTTETNIDLSYILNEIEYNINCNMLKVI